MDEPDYDDLIEDYMEEFDEPPPTNTMATATQEEYDEDFLEEMEAAAGAPAAAASNNNSADIEEQSPASPISNNLNGRLFAAASPSATATTTASAAQIRSQLASSRSHQGDAQPDIFSFERYKRTASWRQDSLNNSPSTMRARGWKSKSHGISASNSSSSHGNNKSKSKQPKSNNLLATTPEAQLLQYQSRGSLYHNPAAPIRISTRRDSGMSLRPKEGTDQVPMTLRDGTRVFVQVTPLPKQTLRTPPSSSQETSYSLGISMADLVRRVQAIKRKKEHDAMKNLSSELRAQRESLETATADDDDEDNIIEDTNDAAGSDAEDEPTTDTNNLVPDDQLWVDKHAPSTFANLLSEERTNREVLRALREWDPYVFQRDPPPRPKFSRPQVGGGGQANNQNNDANDNDGDNSNNNRNPKDKRPDERRRVILLSGPPGVGKTTLAHIVARHCGYQPMEINGSDERSAAVLADRVVRAMETATLDFDIPSATNNKGNSGGNQQQNWRGRPNCIILDEIDGADAQKALAALVTIIRQEMPASKDAKQKSKQPYLKRPIIFICNNLYAPALRPLLPYARRFQVGAPAPSRLVARLRAVLSFESLSLWGGATLLHELVTATGGDIRSCLYTLQFAAAEVRQSEKIDISKALMSALNGNGMKDDRTDVAGTTLTVFKRIKKKGKNDKLWGTHQMSDPRTSVERVLDAVESFGEYSKILDCLYLNLLNVSYIDPTFDRCAAALQWLSGADTRGSQARYVPCAAAALHLLCRVEQKPDLTYTTRSITDTRYQMEANKGLTLKFAEGLASQFRGSRSSDIMAKDTIPYAMWMLSAGEGSGALVRPASSVEVLKKRELHSFESHVATLHSLGLTYVAATEDFEGAYQAHSPKNNQVGQTIQMILEPPIDRLVQYQCIRRTHEHRRQDIPPAMKELLARGATLQGIRAKKASDEQMTPKGNKGGDKKKLATDGSLQPTVTPTAEKTTASSVEKPLVTPEGDGKKRPDQAELVKAEEDRPAKRQKVPAPQSFLGLGAKRAKEAKSARRAKSVGLVRSTKINKKSNSGSGVPFQQVMRLKYVKGFTQAVRNPCRLEDLA